MSTFLTLVGIVATAPFLILAWMWADEQLADKQPEPEPVPNPMLTHPSLRTHQTVARTYDLIAANEAARIDAEWEAMNA